MHLKITGVFYVIGYYYICFAVSRNLLPKELHQIMIKAIASFASKGYMHVSN